MRRVLLMLPSLVVACGAGSSGPGKFTGTVKGNALPIQSAVFLSGAEVWLSDTPNLCAKLTANQFPKSGAFVKLSFQPLATGTFTVDPASSRPNTASLQFFKLDANCQSTLAFGDSVATTGTLTISRFDTTKLVDGSFDATFGTADVTSASFSAAECAAPTLYPSPTCAD
ncbi:MAG: hypothetical protein JNK82_16765 [Myxococcaceae bacterium]|nr:hypothetical protein [Myxococcaceae bacterium]